MDRNQALWVGRPGVCRDGGGGGCKGKRNHHPNRSKPPQSQNFPAFPPNLVSDTARLSQRYLPIAGYGVFGVSTWPIGCDTPSPFSERFPLESMRSGGAIPPLKRGISAILARYPMKTRQTGCDAPLCDTISKGYCANRGLSRTWPLSPQIPKRHASRTKSTEFPECQGIFSNFQESLPLSTH